MESKADVERAIQQYMSTRPGLTSTAMSMEVKQVTFRGEQAEAEVVFRSKDNPQASMSMRYVLKRAGGNTWSVDRDKSRSLSAGHPADRTGEAHPQGQLK
jgi:hypothetical protein